MAELGQLLKKTRMEQGFSLEHIQEITKIQKRYLEAIEEGNYKILPGSFYVRAFIKSYAEALGLEPNEVLRMYHNIIPSPQSEQIKEQPVRRRRERAGNTERFNKWISGIMMWSFVILIAGIIYYFLVLSHKPGDVLDNVRLTDRTSPHSADLDANSATYGDRPPIVIAPPVEAEIVKPEVKLSRTVSGTDYYDVTNTEIMTVEITVTGDRCWFQIDEIIDGEQKLKETKILTEGESRTWDFTNSAYLNIGKANAIEIKVNGITVPVGDAPNPKRFQFDL